MNPMPKPRGSSLRALFATFTVATAVVPMLPRTALADPPSPPSPPPAAFEACASKSQGAACTVSFHDRQIEGTCETFPSDSRLACRPSGPPPGPPPQDGHGR